MADDLIVSALRAAAVDGDARSLEAVLHPNATWASCVGSAAIIDTFNSMTRHGLRADSLAAERHGDRLVVTAQVTHDDASAELHQAMFTDDGLILHIVDAADAQTAASIAAPVTDLPNERLARVMAERIAPIFVVADIDAAAEHYSALGFEVEHYGGDAAYGFARRGAVEIHLAGHAGVDPLTTTSAAYLYVDSADALHAEWRASGQPGRFHEPEDTEYGLREGAHVDPWGNLIRYGSPLG